MKSKLVLPSAHRDHIRGSIEAPLTLVEYGDYECPYCGEAEPMTRAVQKELGERLCFAFRNFPLVNTHPHAEHAAEAAEAAGAQGHFWEMHDLLFERQEALEDESLWKYASTLSLDVDRLMRDVLSGSYAERLREDYQSGLRNGVNGTPSFFVNGIPFDGELSVKGLLAALAESS